MPIPLGILAVAGAGGGAASGAFEQIQTQLISTAVSSVTFSSIPSTYKHLQLRTAARDSQSGFDGWMTVRVNGDSGTSYRSHGLISFGSSLGAENYGNDNKAWMVRLPAASDAANIFGAGIIDILDYVSTAKNKTMRSLFGSRAQGGYTGINSGLWISTTAINSLTIQTNTTSNFVAGSRFTLYGIKG